jgi:hypothetical protein
MGSFFFEIFPPPGLAPISTGHPIRRIIRQRVNLALFDGLSYAGKDNREAGTMRADEFQGQRLKFNDEITYTKAETAVQNPDAPLQLFISEKQLYTGKIVDFTDHRIGVRQGGMWSSSPLYYVWPEDIRGVRKQQARTR